MDREWPRARKTGGEGDDPTSGTGMGFFVGVTDVEREEGFKGEGVERFPELADSDPDDEVLGICGRAFEEAGGDLKLDGEELGLEDFQGFLLGDISGLGDDE